MSYKDISSATTLDILFLRNSVASIAIFGTIVISNRKLLRVPSVHRNAVAVSRSTREWELKRRAVS